MDIKIYKTVKKKAPICEINKRQFNITELRAYLCATNMSLNHTVWAGMNIAQRKRYIQDCIFCKVNRIPKSTRIFMRDDARITTMLAIKIMPMNPQYMKQRLELWELKQIDCDELFKPTKPRTAAAIKRALQKESNPTNWKGLTGKDRSHKLCDIPSPTEIERKLYPYTKW